MWMFASRRSATAPDVAIAHAHDALVKVEADGEHFRPELAAGVDQG
jgi:hypothetical protein